VKTFEVVLAWVGFLFELLKDGKEKYEKHFAKIKSQESEAPKAQEQNTNEVEENTQDHE